MAKASLEDDGYIKPPMEISEDPFEVLSRPLNNASGVSVEAHYSDISDEDDFDIPCSQKRIYTER